MRVKCYSIRLKSLKRITYKALNAIAFDGTTAIIPISQYYGEDYSGKDRAHWISAWILQRRTLPQSKKKEAWFDSKTKQMLSEISIKRHIPAKIGAKKIDPDETLTR